MAAKTALLWFRNDLRLGDHAAVTAAADCGCAVVPVYILDATSAGPWRAGGASRWWLHHSLVSLARALEALGSSLVLRRGVATQCLAELIEETGASEIYFTRRYEPWARAEEQSLKEALDGSKVRLRRFGGGLLIEPESLAAQSGDPYKVYTPFWRTLSGRYRGERPLKAPVRLAAPKAWPTSERLAAWRLLPERPNWAKRFSEHWSPGETGARQRLDAFLADGVERYVEDRNRPDVAGTSLLSPHLAHGEISPRSIWWQVADQRARTAGADRGHETFLKELVWREFSAHLLFHFPHLPEAPFRPEFSAFPWQGDGAALKRWQRGLTGFPIVDAGMRELWATGHMHNRVRMIVASFLVKDLLIPWQTGAAWFWDTLVDADLANNSASWQWVAGSGADAAPYFRIFNPVTQGETFDPQGVYVRRWVPEIARLPDRYIHRPFEADPAVLAAAGSTLGTTYPRPIVDHKAARQRALEAFAALKAAGSSGKG